MPEPADLTSLLAGLRGQPPPAPFATAAAVRRRGRQRSRRRAASIGVTVLLVAGLGGGAVVLGSPAAGPPAPPPGATTATTAAPEQIPAGWLLSAADLGPGWDPTTHELFESEPAWYWGNLCGEYRSEDYPSLAQRRDLATAAFRRDDLPVPGRVDQVVELFEPGVAAANLDDVQAVTALCSDTPAPGDEVASTEFEIMATGFAGDESRLIEVSQHFFDEDGEFSLTPHRQYVAVVRAGDAVTTIISASPDEAERVAEIAAARLP